jgi:hypothetical protein
MEAAVPPIRNARYVPVFDRIEMNIVNMTFEVGIVPDCMFPEATLPNPLLAFDNLARRPWLVLKAAREPALDQAPAGREIRISFGQSPNRMNVVGQDTDRDSLEWVALMDKSIGLSQAVDLVDK